MTDTGFIDLNAVESPDVRVAFGDREYRLPGDPPSGALFRISMLAQEMDKETQKNEPSEKTLANLREELDEEIGDLFARRKANWIPDPETGEMIPPRIELSEVQIAELLGGLVDHYAQAAGKGEEGAESERPTSPASTPQKPRSLPRSGQRSKARKRTPAGSASSPSSQT